MKLYRLSDDKFIFMNVERNLSKTISALFDAGIHLEEIFLAINDLCTNNLHVAEFGVNKTYIFSKKVA